MFTGIITHQAAFKGYNKGKTEIILDAPQLTPLLNIGDSLAVDGVCLSLIKKTDAYLYFHLSRETLERTTLRHLLPGTRLNVELPATPETFLSGHLVSGHIDGTGKIIRVFQRREGKRIRVGFQSSLKDFLVSKGSVALNGVSLTIAQLGNNYFETELIPITLKKTNLGQLKPGDMVNIECDIIGKYLYNWISKKNF